MTKIEVFQDPTLPIIIVYTPPFVNWDGTGSKVVVEVTALLDEAVQPMVVLADLSDSIPTLLQISTAANFHGRSNWIKHINLAGVLVVSQDPDIRAKVMKEMSLDASAPVKYFADRASALRSLGLAITV